MKTPHTRSAIAGLLRASPRSTNIACMQCTHHLAAPLSLWRGVKDVSSASCVQSARRIFKVHWPMSPVLRLCAGRAAACACPQEARCPGNQPIQPQEIHSELLAEMTFVALSRLVLTDNTLGDVGHSNTIV